MLHEDNFWNCLHWYELNSCKWVTLISVTDILQWKYLIRSTVFIKLSTEYFNPMIFTRDKFKFHFRLSNFYDMQHYQPMSITKNNLQRVIYSILLKKTMWWSCFLVNMNNLHTMFVTIWVYNVKLIETFSKKYGFL